MTNPNTKREDEIEGLFKAAGDAARGALTSARAACDRQTAIIADLGKQIEAASANTVDDATLESWTQQVNQAVAQAEEISKAFDAIGVPPTTTPQPPVDTGLPDRPTHPDYGIPRPEPQKKK